MTYSIVQALLVGLWAAFCFAGQVWGTYTNRALFISFGIGLILGDLQTAVIFGATAELAFMGFGVGPGGSTPPNPLGPGVVGTIMAISIKNLTPNAALSLSYPFAILIPFVITFIFSVNSNNITWARKAIEEGKYRRFHFLANTTLIGFILFAFVFGFVATLSTNALQTFVEIIPKWLINGLSVAGGLLPAVGFALIISTMVKKEYIPALILGYICTAYLKIPVIGLAFAGAVLAFNNYYNAKKPSDHNDSGDGGNDGNSNEEGGIEDGI
ncbi:PTS mannose/fructose/sorbose/N-acetylgalactosamine transporter subunit IIC [Schleiferilactobacillus perolens]|jgi:PTS system N-acetylgalactosamine-specific IIC component|uniref:PTS system, N-acetylgalactosamine-specific IIC component n=1 Tax=Schleiferilactobacillus perolens DSM 12744 TaxID=1423792 RepID=A0A0R1N844_9LACO|nr:PTS mannose/fructose/sorbose/N-acetylgalactosamine transporter subunit IIC [Schleiferilactobacillus perolens]KRL12472.1 PTS system, N-acetylgalactosamine-specific IIC component [Schleiferilactobacillus perolens DSM 12744]MCI2171077.1 PTS mannose/fructose/sorbose/N-acetylgalactosamine transporter subunit IIC [Schleiferilactobacillus perolens]